jgi:hypothetical protein
LYYYPAVSGSRHSSNDKPEAVSFDFWLNRPPTKYTYVELPK